MLQLKLNDILRYFLLRDAINSYWDAFHNCWVLCVVIRYIFYLDLHYFTYCYIVIKIIELKKTSELRLDRYIWIGLKEDSKSRSILFLKFRSFKIEKEVYLLMFLKTLNCLLVIFFELRFRHLLFVELIMCIQQLCE